MNDASRDNPYSSLPAQAFWRTAVAERHPLDIAGLWSPKHKLTRDQKIVTAGSCFAQHIGRALKGRGFEWFDAEPAPEFASDALKREYNYGIFSFRTGNIYTAALLRQWLRWALGVEQPPAEAWEHDGRWFDPFRPAIEPNGFASREEMLDSREDTLRAIRRAVDEARVFVFTLGLTEGWVNAQHGYVYPMCPGTLRGTFDPAAHKFHNYGYAEIRRHMAEAMQLARSRNRKLRFLLTVSPVPLTATASGEHVLVATTYSKSVLRAVAGDLATRPDTDYFPSYEIITAFPYRGQFFEPNLRSVSPHGVGHVMDSFFRCMDAKFPGFADAAPAAPARARAATPVVPPQRPAAVESDEDPKCEEELLAAFGPGAA
jgi:hypothetical protein